jgi:hypothetical protein
MRAPSSESATADRRRERDSQRSGKGVLKVGELRISLFSVVGGSFNVAIVEFRLSDIFSICRLDRRGKIRRQRGGWKKVKAAGVELWYLNKGYIYLDDKKAMGTKGRTIGRQC